MNTQCLAAKLPDYLVIVLVLVLTGCTTIRVATVDAANPVSTATSITFPLPTATKITTATPNTLPMPPAITPSVTLSPTIPATSTPLPSATPVSSPTLARQPDPPVERRLLVKQEEQLMMVYENGIVVRTIPVSTGAPITNKFTPPWQGIVGDDWGSGPFRNRQYADYMWYLFPGPEGSILIHSVPYTITNGLKVFDRPEALGVEPVSNGCVRISPEDGAWLKSWNPVGVPITITRWPGKLQPAGTIAENITGEERKNE